MLYLIKKKNIFDRFYKDTYTIEYQKHSFPYIYLLIFLNLANEFFEIFHINKIIYTKLLIVESDLTNKLIKIVISIKIYDLYRRFNFYSSYMSNI